MLDLLQEDDVSLVLPDLGQGGVEVDRRSVGIGVMPNLPELHIELEHPEGHRRVRLRQSR
jgi:hypothetical protein